MVGLLPSLFRYSTYYIYGANILNKNAFKVTLKWLLLVVRIKEESSKTGESLRKKNILFTRRIVITFNICLRVLTISNLEKALIFAIIGGIAAGNTLTRFVLARICGDY